MTVNYVEICKSVNVVSIIYTRSMQEYVGTLNFDPRVMTFYWLFVTTSYIDVLLLYVVFFLLFNCLTFVFTLIVYVLRSICNRIVCVCHLIIQDYLLTYLRGYRLASTAPQPGRRPVT